MQNVGFFMTRLICLSGPEAKKLYNDAQTMLKKIIENKSLKAHGVVAFYPANSTGDDIEVYDNNGEVIAVLHGLRQQVCLSVCLSLSICLCVCMSLCLSANSTGDDIEVYDKIGEIIAVLHGLRQQVCLSVRSWTPIDTCWVLTCINGKNLVSTASPKCTHPITFLDL